MWRLNNCLFFALYLFIKRGGVGYVSVRWSRWGRFPHFLYEEMRHGKIKQISYIPVNPRHKKIPPFLFKGKIKIGDV